jgi:hypothetical protein
MMIFAFMLALENFAERMHRKRAKKVFHGNAKCWKHEMFSSAAANYFMRNPRPPEKQS